MTASHPFGLTYHTGSQKNDWHLLLAERLPATKHVIVKPIYAGAMPMLALPKKTHKDKVGLVLQLFSPLPILFNIAVLKRRLQEAYKPKTVKTTSRKTATSECKHSS